MFATLVYLNNGVTLPLLQLQKERSLCAYLKMIWKLNCLKKTNLCRKSECSVDLKKIRINLNQVWDVAKDGDILTTLLFLLDPSVHLGNWKNN